MEEEQAKSPLEFCLDFVNTVDWRNGRQGKVREDGLTGYSKLVDWGRQEELISVGQARRLDRIAKESGKEASTLRHAIELRETIYRVFSRIADSKKPDAGDLGRLNDFISESMAKSRLTQQGAGYQWSWAEAGEAPDMVLWPVAKSAADLLTSDRLRDVRECANKEEGCGWLFLDNTKNRKRKWCSTSSCGNRDKVRRFYERHRE